MGTKRIFISLGLGFSLTFFLVYLLFSGQISELKVITPNNDGVNDFICLKIPNPYFADIEGKIFDFWGGLIRELTPDENKESFRWEGKDSGGNLVLSGIYFYQIICYEPGGKKIYSGTIIVAR
jgi:gliding motility-associated-like protein